MGHLHGPKWSIFKNIHHLQSSFLFMKRKSSNKYEVLSPLTVKYIFLESYELSRNPGISPIYMGQARPQLCFLGLGQSKRVSARDGLLEPLSLVVGALMRANC